MSSLRCCLALLLLCTLSGGARAAETVAAPAMRDDSAAEKLGWHLANKAYTFRNLTLFETIDITRSLGLKYFELNPTQKLSPEHPEKSDASLTPELRAALKQRFAEAGIKVVNFGVVKLTSDEAADRKIFAFAKELGIETLVSEPEPDAFPLLDRLTEEYGLRVAIHNHPKPSRYAEPEAVLKALEGHSARLGACADTGHWTRSGLNAVECLKLLAGRVITLHFKDVDAQKRDVPWGTGLTDVKGMLQELRRQNFRGTLSMEYESGQGAELLQDLAASIRYFDQTAGGLTVPAAP